MTTPNEPQTPAIRAHDRDLGQLSARGAARLEAAIPLVDEVIEADDDSDEPAAAPAKKKGRKKVPAWSDAIPDDMDLSDPLEVAAKLGPRAVAVALMQMIVAPGVKATTRAAMISQLASQLPGLIDKRRLWEAEKAVRGDATSLEKTSTGPRAERNPLKDAARTQTDPTASGAKALRGRPRKRSLL